ncbi:MAG: TlpA disulfide reductase family protein [Sedimentisphaerales bacterium]
MKINFVVKKVISFLAVVLNVVFFCWLIYEIIHTSPVRSNWMIPFAVGLFLIINIIALILGKDKSERKERGILGPYGNSIVRLAAVVAALLVFMGLGFWIGFSSHNTIEKFKWQHKREIKMAKFMGKKAPDVAGKTLDGREWKLRQQTGKVVLLDFWATWCGPCVASAPQMKQIYEKYKNCKDFVMVGISLDNQKKELVEFCKEQRLAWMQLFEEGGGWNNSIARAFEISGIPSCWIIDKEGNIAGMDIHSGSPEEVKRIIEKNLSSPKGDSDL